MMVFKIKTLSLKSFPTSCFRAVSTFEKTDSKLRQEYPAAVFNFLRKHSQAQHGLRIALAMDSCEIKST